MLGVTDRAEVLVGELEELADLRVVLDLVEQGRITGIDTSSQPVDDHIARAFADNRRIFIMRGQGVPVGDEVKTLVAML